jgi:hypothetical protein
MIGAAIAVVTDTAAVTTKGRSKLSRHRTTPLFDILFAPLGGALMLKRHGVDWALTVAALLILLSASSVIGFGVGRLLGSVLR